MVQNKKSNNKKKNMSNSRLKTKAETKTRTRLITGIVIAAMVAIGIGTAIWYFAGVGRGEETYVITDDFDNINNVNMDADVVYNNQKIN